MFAISTFSRVKKTGSGQCLEPYAVAKNYLKIDRGMSNEA